MEHHHWFLHIWISLGRKFILKVTILLLKPNLPKKKKGFQWWCLPFAVFERKWLFWVNFVQKIKIIRVVGENGLVDWGISIRIRRFWFQTQFGAWAGLATQPYYEALGDLTMRLSLKLWPKLFKRSDQHQVSDAVFSILAQRWPQ